nr:hypothetical protein [Halomonas elongata]
MKALLLLFALLLPLTATAQVVHYPAASGTERPEPLIVQGALDVANVRPLLDDFHRRHPHVELTYRNLDTLPLYRRFLASPDEADVLISSAMPWQYRLVNDGHARSLDTPQHTIGRPGHAGVANSSPSPSNPSSWWCVASWWNATADRKAMPTCWPPCATTGTTYAAAS